MTDIAITTMRAAIYTRVSQDASGVARSPREQEAESRRDVERNGWQLVDVYTDNDRSASRYARKVRAGWVRVLADLAAGAFDVLVVWEASRLARDLEAYATLASACRAANVRLSYNGRVFDLDDPDDEFNVGLDMLLAQRESGVTRKRINRAMRASAAAGRPHGKTAFGYRRVYDEATGQLVSQELDPAAAAVVAEIFDRVIAGDALHAIARDLERRGVVTQQGGAWTPGKVRQMLAVRTYLGHRVYRGEVVVEGAWPAIVDEVTFARANAIVNAPGRRTNTTTKVRHLMSGMLSCSTCGSTVSHTTVGGRIAVYRCKAAGHVAVKAATLEAGVRELVAARLSRPDALAVFATSQVDVKGARAELKALEAQLDEADDALAAAAMSARAHGKLEARVAPRIAELEALLATAERDVPRRVAELAAVDVDEVRDRWDALDLADKRAVVRELLVECELRAAPATRRRLDLGLRFRWAGVGDPVDV